jgi:hypothetical protein
VLTGKQFRLTRPTVALHIESGTRRVLTIPAEALVEVLPGPDANGKVPEKGVVYATWEDRTVALFVVDLEDRGIEVLATANRPSTANA